MTDPDTVHLGETGETSVIARAAGTLARVQSQVKQSAMSFAGRRRSYTRMRHQTLVLLRWLAIIGQTLAVLFVHFVLGHEVPLVWCSVPILASLWLNIVLFLRYAPVKRLSDREAAFYMGFDILQLSSLLYLTGGLLNPFAVLLLAPVTIAASTLSLRSALILAALAMAAVTLMGLFQIHWALPWPNGGLMVPWRYEVGGWVALVLAIGFSTIFAWRVASEANRMSDALAATEMVLAREQRLAAVGGLAAAAAHELGTPLATISVVTKELEREIKADSPLAEDVNLLRAQAERCREILNRLTREAKSDTAEPEQVSLLDLLEEVCEPHRLLGIEVLVQIHSDTAADSESQQARSKLAEKTEIWRRPEIVHGLGNIVENAVDFATERVVVEATLTSDTIRVRVIDDGPGFAREMLDHLGEPFTSTRSRIGEDLEPETIPDNVDDNHGMGLGFFIAKTLLERTGGRVVAANRSSATARADRPGLPTGAVVSITWPRASLSHSRSAGASKLVISSLGPKGGVIPNEIRIKSLLHFCNNRALA